MNPPPVIDAQVEAFIHRWESSGASERANYALFLTQLCDLLGVPQPEPTGPDNSQNSYVFERDVTFDQGDGTTSIGRIDLYKRGCFVLEAKQGSDQLRAEEAAAQALAPPSAKKPARKTGTAVRGTKAWDDAMIRARGQAEAYAKALPPSEGWPPFLIVVDVGHSIELYSEFTRAGKAYVMFPDPQSFRLKLGDLRDEKIRARLALVWTDPLALDPSRRSAKVTRELAERLAALAKLLEKAGHEPAVVAKFLMRCLFTMFAEDVDLIPRGAFAELLVSLRAEPENFQPMLEALWQTMNTGGFSSILRKKILQFNGGLFAESSALPLDKHMLELLIEAAKSDWADVEPAIFGTLLERALDTNERHKLGAHYTPRAYVERLVMPTVIEPLRDQWKTTYAAAITHANAGELDEAQAEVRAFHDQLCEVRVLDPACGSGNFLYVTLEHMKRLEGEVLLALRELGDKQGILETHEVDPHQFLGIELNPRAAAIADLVLWIGYLQWHFRTRGKTTPAEPIIRNYKNIECRDAVLAWDRTEPELDASGAPLTRWDGRTMKRHPVTGEEVPDDTARVPELRYINPRKVGWPTADYIVGNPPFIGPARMRSSLGNGYTEALRGTYPFVPESCDYVMYWWYLAGTLVTEKRIKQFGFITTNSLRQTFSRRVLEGLMQSDKLSIVFAIPDHPWVSSEDGAAVRISMSVARAGYHSGELLRVVRELDSDTDTPTTELVSKIGRIQPDITIGAAVHDAAPIQANMMLSNRGVCVFGSGFIISEDQASMLNSSLSKNARRVVREYRNGRDLTARPRGVKVIDLFGLSEDETRQEFPEIYQWVINHVKPERDQNRDKAIRENWWLHGRPRPELRQALSGLHRYVATVETSKHRTFQFLDADILPDNKLVCVALDDALYLGVLSSRPHVVWALASGSHLGVGNDPVYVKSACFERFPFPVVKDSQSDRIRQLAEQLDAHRKRQQAAHPKLTLTEMYNVLEKLRAGEPLAPKEKTIHDQGLVSVLKQLHDDLDAAVFAAYGWPTTLGDEEILARLVALNAARAAEEAQGQIRWLRPEFQAPQAGQQQPALALTDDDEKPAKKTKPVKAAKAKAPGKTPWPKQQAERTKAVQELLATLTAPSTPEELAKRFLRGNPDQISEILDALCSLGLARKSRGKFSK